MFPNVYLKFSSADNTRYRTVACFVSESMSVVKSKPLNATLMHQFDSQRQQTFSVINHFTLKLTSFVKRFNASNPLQTLEMSFGNVVASRI